MNEHTSKGTLYARDQDGGLVVIADGVDITYACGFDHDNKRITLPDNLPEGCTVSCSLQGYRVANALHRETARQRKAREAAESAQRAAMRAAPEAESVGEDTRYAINLVTYCVWRALYGPNQPSPFPISAGSMPEEETCSS